MRTRGSTRSSPISEEKEINRRTRPIQLRTLRPTGEIVGSSREDIQPLLLRRKNAQQMERQPYASSCKR